MGGSTQAKTFQDLRTSFCTAVAGIIVAPTVSFGVVSGLVVVLCQRGSTRSMRLNDSEVMKVAESA